MDAHARHPDDNRNQSFRDVAATVEQLTQTQCTSSRSNAIVAFCKGLRRGHLFQPLWDGVEGAAGLASLMNEFSLRDVRLICRHLGATASAQNARPERHAGLAELVRLLHEDGPAQRDRRPLRQYYRDIVPACDLGFVREWRRDNGRTEWTKFQRVCLFRNHREWYQQRFLKDLSSPTGAARDTSFSAESRLFQGDLGFAKTILSTLIANKQDLSHIPHDFLSAFALPLLRRLVRRRKYDDEKRDRFLSLVVQCIAPHTDESESHSDGTESHSDGFESHSDESGDYSDEFESYSDDSESLSVEDQEELVRYTTQRWSTARVRGVHTVTTSTKEQTELCLRRLIELLPSSSNLLKSLETIFSGLLRDRTRTTHVDSYQLLRLILQHAQGYQLDIDDDSPLALSRLNDLKAQGDLWPMRLFLYLDVEDSIGLFERLSAADPTSSFLTTERRSRSSSLSTVLRQHRRRGSSCGDAEIVRYLLLSKSRKKGADDPVWLARARTLIHERRKKSEENREWQQREFWARSAMNLCVAAGDMEMLDDTVLWARRFNNQPLVAKGLYNDSTFGTEEIIDLLSAVPREYKDGEDSLSDQVTGVTKAIIASGRILVHLMETIKMIMSSQPGENRNWGTLLNLPKLVVDSRLEKKNAAAFDALFRPAAPGSNYPSDGAVETVWKPTIDTLVMAEAVLSGVPQLSVQATGTHVFHRLPGRSGKVRADLTSFLLQKMKMHLGSEGLRLQMNKVVDLVTGVASSDQPWLATPFICDLVLDGEDADSAWHRSLLSPWFLSSLPYKAASGLLHTIADTMKERMREQNARPGEEIGVADGKAAVPRPPMIKVTTVKMMAQLLQGNRIIGESEACDILIGLLGEARHIDALVAIVNSLLSFLKRPESPGIHSRILDGLEEKLSPILSQLSQRRPLSEADWAAVESGEADLPDVADEKPLTTLLCSQVSDSKAMSRETRVRLIELLVRVPAESALQNTRWNTFFLARNGFSLDDGERLPAAPACRDVSIKLLSQFRAYVPASTVNMLRGMALVNLDPTPGIVRVTEAVKANRDLADSNAGRHWLAQFDNPGPKALERFGVCVAASLLQRSDGDLSASKRDDGDGVTLQLVKEWLLVVAHRMIVCQLPGAFGKLVSHLSFTWFKTRANWLAWREHCVPVLGAMAAEVDELRRRLPGGEPVPRVLPSLFDLYAGMLPVPYSNPPKEPAPDEEMDVFVTELSQLVEWLVRRGLPYHAEFAQLKTAIRRELNRGDYARVALRLGRLRGGTAGEEEGVQGPTLASYLRLELAGHLLAEAGDSLDDGCGVLAEAKNMVREWVASDDELVRLTGMAVEKKHKAVFS